MIKLGLLGKEIAHSQSPAIYKTLLQTSFSYDLIDCISEETIPPLSELAQKYNGINITAPYKRFFLEDLVLDECAKKIGAVNCILFKDKNAYGTNTDFEAFKKIFAQKNYAQGFTILILGDGAMAEMAKIAFTDLGCSYIQFSRKKNGDLNEVDYLKCLKENSQPLLFVNCCSRSFLFDPQKIINKTDQKIVFFDLNYSSENQKNLCGARGFSYYDGYEMLVEQARLATVFWSII